jgi:hypothetical protein
VDAQARAGGEDGAMLFMVIERFRNQDVKASIVASDNRDGSRPTA